MKSVTVDQDSSGSGFLIKDGNEYFLILILLNRLLSAGAFHHRLDKTNSPEQQGPC